MVLQRTYRPFMGCIMFKLIFKNQQRVIDGPSYGFLFNPVGIAIGAYAEKNSMQAQNIEITNFLTHFLMLEISIQQISKKTNEDSFLE